MAPLRTLGIIRQLVSSQNRDASRPAGYMMSPLCRPATGVNPVLTWLVSGPNLWPE
jgi:hypothetical protein